MNQICISSFPFLKRGLFVLNVNIYKSKKAAVIIQIKVISNN